MQVVSQLELQLQKERDRLQAMMHHLHLSKQLSSPEPHKDGSVGTPTKMTVSTSLSQPSVSIGPMVSAVRSPVLHSPAANVAGPIRRRLNDKSALSLAGGNLYIKYNYIYYIPYLVIKFSTLFLHMLHWQAYLTCSKGQGLMFNKVV